MDTVREKTLTASERHALSDLVAELGPEAPTLCTGWTTRDLAAHLVLRERRADAAPGILLPVMAGYTARVQGRIAQLPWTKLLDLVRNGPPWWSPLSLPVVDRRNALEWFVHHEDVRRAQPEWKPRPGDARRARMLWELLGPMAWVLYRNSPVGIVLRTPEGWQRTARRAQRSVTLLGPPEELILHAFGRDRAVVDVDGDQVDVAKLASSPRGV